MTTSLIVILIFYDVVYCQSDPCTVHKVFNDSSFRTDNYFVENSLPCVSFPSSPVPAWYRYTGNVGGTMATQCPETSACTAKEQIWIKGSLPSFHGHIKQVESCINIGSDCCALENFIRVKNCNFYYVYELRRTPNCETKYCFNATAVPLVTQATILTTVGPNTTKTSKSITTGDIPKMTTVTHSTTSKFSTKSSTGMIISNASSPSTQKISKPYSSNSYKYTSVSSIITTWASLPTKQTTNPTASLTQSSQSERFSRTDSIPATVTVIINNRTSTEEIWKQKSSENSLSSGTITAIAVGTGCVVIIILAAVIVILHKRKIFKADRGKRSATYKVHKQEHSQIHFNLTHNIS